MYLPNLIVIGGMKCGSTSLHKYLSIHPDIFMSTKKELDFFCNDEKYAEGMDWYKANFPEKTPIRGESSQNYSKWHWWDQVPSRVHKAMGDDMKFVYILRDPLKRVYSHYNEMQAQDCAPASLEDYISKDLEENEIIRTSSYHYQLLHFLKIYPLGKFKIVTLEDLNSDRLEVMNQIFAFLGVDQMENESIFDFTMNTSKEKKSRTSIGRLIVENPLIVGAKKMMPTSFKESMKKSEKIKSILFKDIKREIKLSNGLEEKLKDIFRKDTDQLRQLTGLPFDKWCV